MYRVYERAPFMQMQIMSREIYVNIGYACIFDICPISAARRGYTSSLNVQNYNYVKRRVLGMHFLLDDHITYYMGKVMNIFWHDQHISYINVFRLFFGKYLTIFNAVIICSCLCWSVTCMVKYIQEHTSKTSN